MNAFFSHTYTLLLATGLALVAALACEPTDALRFTRSERVFVIDDLGYTVVLEGAFYSGEITVQDTYACPVPGGREELQEVSLIQLEITSPTPLIEVRLPEAITSGDGLGVEGFCPDTSRPLAIELNGLPLDGLEAQSCERSDGELICTTREGRYRIYAVSVFDESAGADCARSLTREASDSQTDDRCAVCDAYTQIPILTELRTEPPDASGCCEDASPPRHVFCVNPCPCRVTRYHVERIPDGGEEDLLRIAVISELHGDVSRLRAFTAAARERAVDLVVNIGDLTEGGGEGALTTMDEVAEANLVTLDTGEPCASPDAPACCRESRDHPNICEAVTERVPLLAGIGENETDEESFETFFDRFGPSNISVYIGGVQLILLDSADATLGAEQFSWLTEQLAVPEPRSIPCDYPRLDPTSGPTHLGRDCSDGVFCDECMGSEGWVCLAPNPETGLHLPEYGNRNCLCTYRPILGEHCGGGQNTCDDCIQLEGAGVCVPPLAGRSFPEHGAANCMCVAANSTFCPGNFSCKVEVAEDGSGEEPHCICTRDEDCGPGFTCDAGDCVPPLRMVFTHTPPLDLFGARNAAFRSRREAARLLAEFVAGEVDYLFAGAINTYRNVLMANIPTIITGGGGAELEVFDDSGHHWLLVTIPGAYSRPDPDNISVEKITLCDEGQTLTEDGACE